MAGSTGTATITGLMASTSYDYSVREICSLGDTCSWSADATVTTAACALSNQCQYTVYLIDSYGDGWNGNVVTFHQSGNVNALLPCLRSPGYCNDWLVFLGFCERGLGNTWALGARSELPCGQRCWRHGVSHMALRHNLTGQNFGTSCPFVLLVLLLTCVPLR